MIDLIGVILLMGWLIALTFAIYIMSLNYEQAENKFLLTIESMKIYTDEQNKLYLQLLNEFHLLKGEKK